MVYAWDSKEKQLLAWRCENEYPSALQLSKNGRSFAICLVGTEQATNYARFVAFSFHKKDPVTDLRIDGAWLYGVAQVSGGWLAVGDKAIYRIKRDASEDCSYENRGLDRFDVGNGGVCAVLLEDWDNRSLLRAYNRRGDLVLEQGFAQRPLDLVCDGNTVYLRFATFLLRWSKALGFRQSQALPKNTQKALVTGTEAYLLTVNSVERQKLRWGAAEESLFY